MKLYAMVAECFLIDSQFTLGAGLTTIAHPIYLAINIVCRGTGLEY